MIGAMAVGLSAFVTSGASSQTDIHTYGHYNLGELHCTAPFDHWPQVEEFHYCGQVCANNATVAVLD